MKKFLMALFLSVGLVSCASVGTPGELPECGAVIKAAFGGDGWNFISSKATGPESLGFVFKKGDAIRLVVLAVKDSNDAEQLAKHPSFQSVKAVECKYDDGSVKALVFEGNFDGEKK